QRNFLATLACSLGVPMLSHGDELGRTQHGNNNGYCQDNPTTWVDWDLTPARSELLEFTRRVFRLRAATPLLRRHTFPRGPADGDPGDLVWFRFDGEPMTPDDWAHAQAHAMGMLLRAEAEALFLALNAGGRSRTFVLPALDLPGDWRVLVHTSLGECAVVDGAIAVPSRSLVLLRLEVAG
ncbi:MAG: glycogen debranching enzyme, partial [Deltaproteobacteria bacterium]